MICAMLQGNYNIYIYIEREREREIVSVNLARQNLELAVDTVMRKVG